MHNSKWQPIPIRQNSVVLEHIVNRLSLHTLWGELDALN